MPPEPPLDDLVSGGGGFYDWDGVRALLHLDQATLEAAVLSRTVLCLRDGEGTPAFPAWQFTSTGTVLPFLSAILDALSRGIADEWTWAVWLTSPSHGDNDMTAVDLLAAGSDPRPILEEAQQDAARWAS